MGRDWHGRRVVGVGSVGLRIVYSDKETGCEQEELAGGLAKGRGWRCLSPFSCFRGGVAPRPVGCSLVRITLMMGSWFVDFVCGRIK